MIRLIDLRIDLYRTAGVTNVDHPQEVSVRVTHLPTGLSATCKHEGSSVVARDVALTMLIRKLRANGINPALEPSDETVGRSLADAWNMSLSEAFPDDEDD